jgi:predicted negative regulator of RcsB-dependent stress response
MSEETNNERLKDIIFWAKQNYIKVIIVLILISSFVIGFYLWEKYKEQESQQASILYDEFYTAIDNPQNNISKVLELKNDFKKRFSNQIYLDLMNMRLAKRYLVLENQVAAIELLKEANASLEEKSSNVYSLRDLSRIRLAMLLISTEEVEEAKKILLKTFSFYEPLKYEYLGDLEKKLLNNSEAKKNYIKALSLTNSEEHKNILNIKLSSLIE